MIIGILGAMPEEIGPLLEKFEYQTIEYANNKYYVANYKEHRVIIAYSKIGKVNSTLSATILIEHFSCETILFTGVAGALNEKYDIRDIVIASKLVQHDVDITGFDYPYGFIPEGQIFNPTDEKLNEIADLVAKENNLNIYHGIIATGDQFIHDDKKKEWIRKTFKADAVEMEGASVAITCAALNVPCLIIRTISDKATEYANINFDEFMVESAQISADFIYKIVDKL